MRAHAPATLLLHRQFVLAGKRKPEYSFYYKSMTPIRYRIVPSNPHAHMFEVTCTVTEPDPAGQSFQLPAWIPGSYLIREFARHIVNVRADSQGQAVAVRKTAKDRWQVDPCAGPVSLVADIYAYDLSVRAAYLDGRRGYFNGPSVFLWPVGHSGRPCEVMIERPGGDTFAGWRVATSMERADALEFGFGTYVASSYDELIDHPVEMGEFDIAQFDAGGARHDIVISGRHRGDLERLSRDLSKVCRAHIDLFGGEHNSRAPFDRYVFLILAIGGETYGGLEHRASTSLMLPRDGLPQPGASTVSDAYRASLGVASHEYFHAWNVKRIKPAAFVPYDLSRENYTEQLWIFEGFTSYYDDLMLRRAGVIDTESYLELLGRAITRHLRTPARATQSLAASSFVAWIKYYRQDENAPNAVVSYYVKGSLVALALDLTLRRIGTTSLDEVMRAAWTQYGLTGAGVPERGIEAIASALAGRELTSFFADYARGTAELPFDDLLSAFGVSFSLRAPDGPNDKGGNAAKDAKPRVSLGAVLAAGGDMALKHVLIDGPASVAGLAAGDKLVALDGIRATPDAMERALQARRVGDSVEILAFRRDELMTFHVVLESAPNDTCWLTLADNVPADVVARRDAWLSGTKTTR